MPRPSSLLAIVAAIVFVLVYGALLGWLFRSAPSHREGDVHAYVAEVLARPGGPIEPLPMLRVPDSRELAMQRDPFAPLP